MNTSQSGELESADDTTLEPLLTEREYAHITKRSVASVRRDGVLGKGCPYIKLGALVRYRRQDVRVHLEKNLRACDQGKMPKEPR